MTGAAYDDVAHWYENWAIWPTGLMQYGRSLVAADLSGQRVLDVACGHGRLSRELAAAGADVVGVDVSAEMLNRAQRDPGDGPAIDYRCADIARVEDWWDGSPFDGAACEMALMDIADLDGAVAAVARVLRPGGWFAATLVHPCFPGDITGAGAGLSSWPPDRGYSSEGFWRSPEHDPAGIRIRLGSHHRMLSTYVNTLIRHGFHLDGLAEPPAEDLPRYLAVGCRLGSPAPTVRA